MNNTNDINDVKSLLSKKQWVELEKNMYKNKLTAYYKGELKTEGSKWLMLNMAFRSTIYRRIRVLPIIVSARCIVILHDNGKNQNCIKRMFANSKLWEVESSVISIEEQLDLIRKNEILFDKRKKNSPTTS